MTNAKRNTNKNKESSAWMEAANPAWEIAIYYGFQPLGNLSITKQDREAAKHFAHDNVHVAHVKPEEKIAVIRHHFSKGIPQLPLMFISEKAGPGRKDGQVEYHLDIIGTARSIADATAIKAAYEIARAEGSDDLTVELNSVGDRDSLNRFTRELTSYFKKHLNELHPDCRQKMKKNIFSLLEGCKHEKCKPIIEAAPHSINFLSEPSRAYLMEILELLETTDIPYTINNSLIESPDFATHCIFKIYANASSETPACVAAGCRWSGFAKKIGLKKDVPGVSASVFVKKPVKAKPHRIKKPQFYFIQMGQEAKLKSLILIETLRQARIPVFHSLTKDKLTAQLASAEHLRVPYILIMGQKESMDNTVLIREMSNRSQDTVRLTEIAEYIKKHLLK